MDLFKEKIINKIKNLYQSTDVVFLLFLVLFLNIKLPIKVAALIFIYAFRFNFKFGIRFKTPGRLPAFYLLMILLCLAELLINQNFQANYLILFITCIAIWFFCFLALHQVKLAIEKNGIEKVENALKIFFILNVFFCLLNLFVIYSETKSFNPYTYEGLSYKYFTSTGDYIRGITFDVCTTNMIVNAMGLFYFLYKKQYLLSLLCLCVVLLTTSNLGNLILIVFLAFTLIINRDKLVRSLMLCYLSILIVFMVKVSPANLEYFIGSYKKINKQGAAATIVVKHQPKTLNADSLIRLYVALKNFRLNPTDTLTKKISEEISSINEFRKKIRDQKPELTADLDFDRYSKDMHSTMIDYSRSVYGDSISYSNVPFMNSQKSLGKLVSFLQTIGFVTQNTKKFLLGAGPGNFSSKLTFRALSLNTDGQWPKKFTYRSEDFKENHLKLWLYYQLQPPATHSTLNAPNSAANQLLGEYGFLGVLLFLICYAWYFFRRYLFLSYGRVILPLMMVFLLTDYWFENLSVMIIFETMILLDLNKKENVAP